MTCPRASYQVTEIPHAEVGVFTFHSVSIEVNPLYQSNTFLLRDAKGNDWSSYLWKLLANVCGPQKASNNIKMNKKQCLINRKHFPSSWLSCWKRYSASFAPGADIVIKQVLILVILEAIHNPGTATPHGLKDNDRFIKKVLYHDTQNPFSDDFQRGNYFLMVSYVYHQIGHLCLNQPFSC